MVTVELQSVIGNYTKCLHNLSFNHPYHSKRPTDRRRWVGILRLSQSVSASECVGGEVVHYSSDAYGSCMYGPADETATLHCSASK